MQKEFNVDRIVSVLNEDFERMSGDTDDMFLGYNASENVIDDDTEPGDDPFYRGLTEFVRDRDLARNPYGEGSYEYDEWQKGVGNAKKLYTEEYIRICKNFGIKATRTPLNEMLQEAKVKKDAFNEREVAILTKNKFDEYTESMYAREYDDTTVTMYKTKNGKYFLSFEEGDADGNDFSSSNSDYFNSFEDVVKELNDEYGYPFKMPKKK